MREVEDKVLSLEVEEEVNELVTKHFVQEQWSATSPYIVEKYITRQGALAWANPENFLLTSDRTWIVALTLARKVLSSGTVALTTIAPRIVASFVISRALAPVGT
jgi:hypothetical protein